MELLIFYSIIRHKLDVALFTFQYGATNIEELNVIIQAQTKFTFQYGATNIKKKKTKTSR